MKIKKYFLPDGEFQEAVQDTMALFGVEAGGEEIEFFLPNDGVLVKNVVYYEERGLKTRTTIYYWENNEQRFLEAENQMTGSKAESAPSLAMRLVKLNILKLMREITGQHPGPWGILRGVRPAKIAERLLDQGQTGAEAAANIAAGYGVEPKKAELLVDISLRQREILRQAHPGENIAAHKLVSVYLGIPYCPSKCLYCSFPSSPLPERPSEIKDFLRALKQDVQSAADLLAKYDLAVENIYLGGGTPSSLSAEDFQELLSWAKNYFFGRYTKEFTVEAGRPDSLDEEKIEAMRHTGVTRVSVNPQTMRDKTLAAIGRQHSAEDIIEAFAKIRRAQIPFVNMDVIVGLPGETEDDVLATMSRLAQLAPDNITIHTLAVKRASLLKAALTLSETEDADAVSLPGDFAVGRMFELSCAQAAQMGMRPYYLYRQKNMAGNLENIGYAREGAECLYNIRIIGERQTVIGIGPAACTKVVNPTNWRLNSSYHPKDVATYVKSLQTYLNRRERLLGALCNGTQGLFPRQV